MTGEPRRRQRQTLPGAAFISVGSCPETRRWQIRFKPRGIVCALNGRAARSRRMSSAVLPYKISVLVFIENAAGEQLLLLRAKQPNLGVWTPIGGKLEMAAGESPLECAVRETREEARLEVRPEDMHLFAMIAEKAYQGETHWLMFLFRCKKPIAALPPDIVEGKFAFWSREKIKGLRIPETDASALWPIFDQYRDRFVALRADCSVSPIKITVEQITPAG